MGVKEDMSRQFGRIGRKTSALFEETKLRGRISSLENDVKNLYITVGTTIFSMWKHENVDLGRLVKYFEAIQEKQEEIEEKKIRILQVKARGGEDRTEENAGGKPLRPLLPDLNGKRAGAGSAMAPAQEESGKGKAMTEKDQTAEHTGCARETEDRMSADTGVADTTISLKKESSEEAYGAHSTAGSCSGAAVADHVVIEEEDEASVLQEKFNVNEAVKIVLPDPVQESGYAYCSRCGAACPAGARYCRRCGAKIEV